MSDAHHWVGGDLAVSATGDLLAADGTLAGQQRVLRRLVTNAGEYVFHPDYGAGLPERVGSLLNVDELRALVRAQLALEACVARSPEPQIDVQAIAGGVAVRIQYSDAETARPVVLAFDVTA